MGVVNVTSLIIKAGSGLGFRFRVRAWTEMKIWYVIGMLVSSLGFKGFM